MTPAGYFVVGTREGLPWLAMLSALGLTTSEFTLAAGTFDSRGEASIAAIEGGYLIAYDELVITANAAGVPTSVAWRDGVQNFDILSFADQRWITDMSGATNYSGLSSDRLHFTPSGNPSINYAWPSKLAVYDDGVWLSGQIDEPFNGSYIPEHAFFYRLTPDVVGALSTAAPFSVARESTTFTDAAVTTYPVTSSVTATNFAWEAFSPRTQIGAKWAVEVLAPTPQD